MTTHLIQIRIFSSFTLLHFVSQVATQMRWAVSITYGLMYQLILHLLFFLSLFLFFLRNLFSNDNHLGHLRYPKYSVEIPRGFKGLSWLIVCGGIACVQKNTIQVRLPFFQLFLKLLLPVK